MERRWGMPTLLLAALVSGVTRRGKLGLELLDPSGGIDELQFARVERVADIANVDLQLLARTARGELVAATAAHLREEIFRMDAVFHGNPGLRRPHTLHVGN